MLICGVKVTHDGGVALVDGNQLIFSAEMEKLDNNVRHARIEDFSVIDTLVRQAGYDPGAIDHLVLDGWRKTTKVKSWGGQELSIQLAPYRRGIRDTNLLRPYRFSALDVDYVSYPHYAGHVASAYCTGPFAERGAGSYVLCWDGAMFPYLYHFEEGNYRQVRSIGPLFHLLGDAYHTLAQHFAPFDAAIEWPHTLALPGKIMAYVAFGQPQESATKALSLAYDDAVSRAFGAGGPAGDEQANELAGRRILQLLSDQLVLPGVSAKRMGSVKTTVVRREALMFRMEVGDLHLLAVVAVG